MDFFLSNTQGNQAKDNVTIDSSENKLVKFSETYEHLKKGDRIKMVRKENSPFNCYKGYIGEIKALKKDTGYAMIILHAMNYPRLMRVPCDHFVELEH
jgi:ATP-dependent exoDNAse (exonuclease V) alpha subunit